ncbi:hypothetical protein KIPB_013746, partial [Kipferlia bialata]|eukprot:g13746.t1
MGRKGKNKGKGRPAQAQSKQGKSQTQGNEKDPEAAVVSVAETMYANHCAMRPRDWRAAGTEDPV